MRDQPEKIEIWLLKAQRRMYQEARRGERADLRILVCHANFLNYVRIQAYPVVPTFVTHAEALKWAKEQEVLVFTDLLDKLIENDRQRSHLRCVETAYGDDAY